ncbi:MAG: GNAT family N-acetyltransferase [Bacteroidales bacterium]|jgi:RimJ/RimL family protein N-acetyltransferase|nr:GNAT family N-acetyltransferase [Bacteroidales bacterium]
MKQSAELATARLCLRPLDAADAKELYRYRSDRVINRYQGWIPSSLEEAEEFIKTRVSPDINIHGTWFQFAVVLKKTGMMIGDIGLHFLDVDNRQVELGCTLDRKHHGKGYAHEALTEVISYLFGTLDKHRLIAVIDPENSGSIKLFERLGFRREAHFRKCRFLNGEWVDDLVYALLREEL